MENTDEEIKLHIELECANQLSLCMIGLIKKYITDNDNIINDTNIHNIIIFAFAKSISVSTSFLWAEENNKELTKEYIQYIFDAANELVLANIMDK